MAPVRAHHFCAVPTEATAFLGAVGMILVVLVVFYLYLNKKLCFTTVGGFPCCDVAPTPREKEKKVAARDLGHAFAYEDAESSTDSDEEVIQQLHHSASTQSGFLGSAAVRRVSCMAGAGRRAAADTADEEDGASHRSHAVGGTPSQVTTSATVRSALHYENGAFLKAEDSPLSLMACGSTDDLQTWLSLSACHLPCRAAMHTCTCVESLD
ncbi:hypothetical protein HPB47_000090 [Ixodes persulcatus]|uniref:Uncharacterized protein n=1 Tax=Ixodes persulcatus TaxID=34615 RepID=A0AC60PT52_IXOPE|nr:hypothetical protein HPB47_000090 [Ixodes persulcatus]